MKFLAEQNIFENTDVITRPIFKLDEVAEMNEKALNNLKTELKIPNDVMNSLKINNELNPVVFKGNKLNSKIRIQLLKLAQDFFESLEVPNNAKLKDVLFVGSLANYNWSKFSDIDLLIDSPRPLSLETLARLEVLFEESDLPYHVDIVDAQRSNPQFLDSIKNDCQPWESFRPD